MRAHGHRGPVDVRDKDANCGDGGKDAGIASLEIPCGGAPAQGDADDIERPGGRGLHHRHTEDRGARKGGGDRTPEAHRPRRREERERTCDINEGEKGAKGGLPNQVVRQGEQDADGPLLADIGQLRVKRQGVDFRQAPVCEDPPPGGDHIACIWPEQAPGHRYGPEADYCCRGHR